MPFVFGFKKIDLIQLQIFKFEIISSKKGKMQKTNLSLKIEIGCAHPLVLGDGPDGAHTRRTR